MSTVVVAVAINPADAQIWVDALRDAGIGAGTFERGSGAAFGGMQMVTSRFHVIVAPEDLEEARNVIAELGGARYLAPFDDGVSGGKTNWLTLPAIFGAIAVVLVVVLVIISN